MKFTDIFKFKLFERTDPVDMKTVNENFESVEKLFKGLDQVDNTSDCDKNVASAKKAECDGNGKNISETYLKKTAVANNNTTTEAGFALDARQANPNVDGSLAKQISALNDGLVKHSHTWDSITGKPSAFPPSSSDLLNKIYPVGSIYMSINNVSPQTFIGGTWEQIKNRWLVGAGDEYAVGTYGGNAVHSHTQRMIFTANYAGNNGLMYTAGGTTPTDVIYTGETRSVPPYYAVYMWKRIA